MSFIDFVFGFCFAIGCVLAFGIATTNVEQQHPNAISFTVVDHDISDYTVYTSKGEILATNKYQWKILELNKTYVCDDGFVNRFSNCFEKKDNTTSSREA
jgi:hypothetical protein